VTESIRVAARSDRARKPRGASPKICVPAPECHDLSVDSAVSAGNGIVRTQPELDAQIPGGRALQADGEVIDCYAGARDVFDLNRQQGRGRKSGRGQ